MFTVHTPPSSPSSSLSPSSANQTVSFNEKPLVDAFTKFIEEHRKLQDGETACNQNAVKEAIELVKKTHELQEGIFKIKDNANLKSFFEKNEFASFACQMSSALSLHCCMELKTNISTAARIFVEVAVFQSCTRNLRVEKESFDEVQKHLSAALDTLPSHEVRARHQLERALAASKKFNYGCGKWWEVWNAQGPELAKAVAKTLLSAGPGGASFGELVDPVVNLACSIYNNMEEKWYKKIWELMPKTISNYDELDDLMHLLQEFPTHNHLAIYIADRFFEILKTTRPMNEPSLDVDSKGKEREEEVIIVEEGQAGDPGLDPLAVEILHGERVSLTCMLRHRSNNPISDTFWPVRYHILDRIGEIYEKYPTIIPVMIEALYNPDEHEEVTKVAWPQVKQIWQHQNSKIRNLGRITHKTRDPEDYGVDTFENFKPNLIECLEKEHLRPHLISLFADILENKEASAELKQKVIMDKTLSLKVFVQPRESALPFRRKEEGERERNIRIQALKVLKDFALEHAKPISQIAFELLEKRDQLYVLQAASAILSEIFLLHKAKDFPVTEDEIKKHITQARSQMKAKVDTLTTPSASGPTPSVPIQGLPKPSNSPFQAILKRNREKPGRNMAKGQVSKDISDEIQARVIEKETRIDSIQLQLEENARRTAQKTSSKSTGISFHSESLNSASAGSSKLGIGFGPPTLSGTSAPKPPDEQSKLENERKTVEKERDELLDGVDEIQATAIQIDVFEKLLAQMTNPQTTSSPEQTKLNGTSSQSSQSLGHVEALISTEEARDSLNTKIE